MVVQFASLISWSCRLTNVTEANGFPYLVPSCPTQGQELINEYHVMGLLNQEVFNQLTGEAL